MMDKESTLLSFDNRTVNLVAPPLVVALAWLVSLSPLVFLMKGFHVWMHELGHATVAWMSGFEALPVPFGWTSVGTERSPVVYFVVLGLLGLLFAAGWKERKAWPAVLALILAVAQLYMTWFMPASRQYELQIFAGEGGKFYLSALFMAAFFVQFPEPFRWGACRYLVLFLAASSFIDAFTSWSEVHRGLEDIPWGSMINGEGDGDGDMNILRDVYHWSNHRIFGTYYNLGLGCIAALAGVYAAFAFGLNRLPDLVLRHFHRESEGG
jgi:hypothetical protein